jgi:predicted acyltransferase
LNNSTDSEKIPSRAPRLLSLDVFRGLTIAGMILVNSPGNDVAYAPLEHAAWHGLTPTDLIFPFFLFIVGVSITFALSRMLEQGTSRSAVMAQVFKRTLILFALGVLLNGFPHYHLATLRIPGVLQRIALCYFFASAFFLWTSGVAQLVSASAMLLGYWWVLTHVAAPGSVVGDLSMGGSLAGFIDRSLLGGHLYRPTDDPEGFLSTIPAVGGTLFGVLSGAWLRSSREVPRKIGGFVLAGAFLLAAGWAWGRSFPINKALWTSSFVLVTTGGALLGFAACFWLVDVRGWKAWSKPFEIFGTNAIAAYVLHEVFIGLQHLVHLPRLDGSEGNLRLFITEHAFSPWLAPLNASLAYALCYTGLWLAVLTVLYRRKIFLKV